MCAKRKTQQNANLLFSDDFYSDLREEGMLYASILRSPVPKGKIQDLKINNLPENTYFFGWDDIPSAKHIKILETQIPLFAQDDISYSGQPLGIIAGTDHKLVRKLCKNIKIDVDEHFFYEEKEESNILARREIKSGKDYEPEEDDITVEEEWESDINVQNYSETNGALCICKNGKLYVKTPNQWISNLRKNLSAVTGIDGENIFITRTKLLSKNTNILWLNTLLCCQCAVACINLKKPVKLELTRSEQQSYAENTSSVKISHKTTVSKTGLIKAMDVLIHVNAGAYNPFAQEIADRLAISSTGVYNCPSIKISSNIYKSHSIPSSIDFSIINSKAFYAIENQMNLISLKTGIDPLQLRLLNLKTEAKQNKNSIIFETGRSKDALEAIAKKSIFLRKNAVYKIRDEHRFENDNASPYAPPVRGIGLACALEGTGFAGSQFLKKSLSIELTCTKEKELYIRGIPSSKNIWTIWQLLSSSITGIPPEKIFLDTNFNSKTEPENPETTDASIAINTKLIQKGCEALKTKIASKDSLPVTVKKTFMVNQNKNWDEKNFTGKPYSSTTFAAMIIELELDLALYTPLLRGIYFIIDAGKILNPKTAETSIKNAIQEELREVIEDEEIEATSISIQFMQSDDEPKQIGEIVASLLPAAWASALSQAVGKTITHMPVQTDTIYKLTEKLKTAWNKARLEQMQNTNEEEKSDEDSGNNK